MKWNLFERALFLAFLRTNSNKKVHQNPGFELLLAAQSISQIPPLTLYDQPCARQALRDRAESPGRIKANPEVWGNTCKHNVQL